MTIKMENFPDIFKSVNNKKLVLFQKSVISWLVSPPPRPTPIYIPCKSSYIEPLKHNVTVLYGAIH